MRCTNFSNFTDIYVIIFVYSHLYALIFVILQMFWLWNLQNSTFEKARIWANGMEEIWQHTERADRANTTFFEECPKRHLYPLQTVASEDQKTPLWEYQYRSPEYSESWQHNHSPTLSDLQGGRQRLPKSSRREAMPIVIKTLEADNSSYPKHSREDCQSIPYPSQQKAMGTWKQEPNDHH